MALKDILKGGRGEQVISPEYDEINDTYGGNDYDYGMTSESQTEINGGDSGATIEMKVVKPTSYKLEEAKQFGDLLLDRKTVLLNLESTSLEDARRLLDFLAGVVHAVDGKIEKVGKKTFVATPHNVDVSGSADIAEEETTFEN